MRLACVADVHLHNARRHAGPEERSLNLRCRRALASFEAAVKLAKAQRCSVFAVLGDLFDDDHPSPQLMAEVQRILRTAAPMRVLLLEGNHDQSSDVPGDHALGPLSEDAVVLDTACRIAVQGQAFLMLPHSAQAPAHERLDTLLGKLAHPESQILLMHAGVSDARTASTAPWLVGVDDSIDVHVLKQQMLMHNIGACFAGNWHDYRVWEAPLVVQCGALCPTGWDNPGLEGYGRVIVYDTGHGTSEAFEVPGPRFVKVDGLEALRAWSKPLLSEMHIYLQAVVAPKDLDAAICRVIELQESGAIASGEAVPNVEESAAAAERAATGARSAQTLDAALAAYVGSMPLEVESDREKVHAQCKQYLERGDKT